MNAQLSRKQDPLTEVYAKALFELATEQNAQDEIFTDFECFVALLGEQPELYRALSAFLFPVGERESLAANICSEAKVNKVLEHFIRLLIARNRFSVIGGIFDAYRAFLDERQGIVRGTAVAAAPIGDDQLRQLSDAFSKKFSSKVLLEEKIDPSILGGIIVKVKGKTFDGSLKTTIQNLRASLERQSI